MIKRILKIVNDTKREIFQLLVLALEILAVYKFNLISVVRMILKTQELNFSNLKYYAVGNTNNFILGFIIALITLYYFRKLNNTIVLNRGNVYHKYPYWRYWICSKILGIKECSLVLVPIPMQYMLIIRDTFDKYNIGSIDYPEKSFKVAINKYNFNEDDNKEVNLVLADTYPIIESQIPKEKRCLATIDIEQERNGNFTRIYNRDFIDLINNTIRTLPNGTIINLYATTNPKHNHAIAESVFKQADRGNVEKLYVYYQSQDGIRAFNKKKRIY